MLKVNTLFYFVLSEILLIPFVVAIFRWRRIERVYDPFFTLLTLGVVTEAISYWATKLYQSNALVTNVYGLLECTLLIYQFYRWNSFRMGRRWLYVLESGSILLWSFSNLIVFHLKDYNFPLFRILYPFMLVILSINEINLMITHDNRNLYNNARFVICLAFIIFFLYQILYEGAFLVSHTEKTGGVSRDIIFAFGYVNAFVNVLYLIAVLLVPKKRDSTFERIFDRIRDDN
jgi:hypothetical protein